MRKYYESPHTCINYFGTNLKSAVSGSLFLGIRSLEGNAINRKLCSLLSCLYVVQGGCCVGKGDELLIRPLKLRVYFANVTVERIVGDGEFACEGSTLKETIARVNWLSCKSLEIRNNCKS